MDIILLLAAGACAVLSGYDLLVVGDRRPTVLGVFILSLALVLIGLGAKL